MITKWAGKTHLGDCHALMRAMIADGVRVQCIVTSPPYWGLRDYGVDGSYGLERTWVRHVARMRAVFRLARELLADDGVLWLNYGDSYAQGGNGGHRMSAIFHGHNVRQGDQTKRRKVASNGLKSKDLIGMPWRVAFGLQADGWWLRRDIIWHKLNPMPESISDRPTSAHEYVFLMSRSERYYYDASAIAEPASPDTHARSSRAQQQYAPPGQQPHSGILKERPNARVAFRTGAAYTQRDGEGGLALNHPPPGVNPKAQRKVSGWAEGAGPHTAIEHNKAQSTPRQDGERWNENNGRGFKPRGKKTEAGAQIKGDRMAGFNERWRVKQNESFSEAMAGPPVQTRNVRSVWTMPTEKFGGAHFATFPQELVARCILAGSRPGDVVFDPFMGSGTVAKVATDLGRRYIGCELNPEYIRLQAEYRRTTEGMAL